MSANTMKLWSIISLCAATLLMAAGGRAQDVANATNDSRPSDERQAGVFGGYPSAKHTANFSELPGVPDCSQDFGSASGGGFYAGGLYQLPLPWIARGISVQFRLGYASLTGNLQAPSILGYALDQSGNVVQAVSSQTIASKFGLLQFEPLVSIAPFAFPVSLNIGPAVGFLLGKSYTENEKLVSPSGANFVNGGSSNPLIRNQQQGAIQQTNNLYAGLFGGLSYDFRIRENMLLSPEVGYAYDFTSFLQSQKWKINSTQFGVSLKMLLPTAPLPPGKTTFAELRAVGVDSSGREIPNVSIRIEEFRSTTSFPLLNCVFFDENSADIPSRYHLLKASGEASLPLTGNLSTYYDLLNIIGRRMQQNPKANITVTGYNCGQGPERDNLGLSERRAESVADYLKMAFGIPSSRIDIETAKLPPNPSPPQDPRGMQENRRVEITSDSVSLLQPVATEGVDRVITPPTVRFYPVIQDVSPVDHWEISSAQSTLLLYDSSESRAPHSIDWPMRGNAPRAPSGSTPLDCSLEFSDASGYDGKSLQAHVPVTLVTVQNKKENKLPDKSFVSYGLLPFQLGRPDFKDLNQSSFATIRTSITPTSRISIRGGTGDYGDSIVNWLGVRDRAILSGSGASAQRYDSENPEGRFYNQTIYVKIENQE